MNLEEKAQRFAFIAHGQQTRKYTGEPYTNHLAEVVELVKSVPHTEAMVAAAWLHDVIEDTAYSYENIYNEFGEDVARLVMWLTDISRPEDGNRKLRKAMDRNHLAIAPAEAQTIKLADLISNLKSIQQYDPNFAVVYKREKQELLEVMFKGDKTLMQKAKEHSES